MNNEVVITDHRDEEEKKTNKNTMLLREMK